jgi:predicted GTPase
MKRKKVIIIGAAGRDFHNFNTQFRNDNQYEVVAFTAAQIPDIDGRKYPAELAGALYPDGIEIHNESELTSLIKKTDAEACIFSYSDVPYNRVMRLSAIMLITSAKPARPARRGRPWPTWPRNWPRLTCAAPRAITTPPPKC